VFTVYCLGLNCIQVGLLGFDLVLVTGIGLACYVLGALAV
jgi:hypothetical protein